MLFQHIRSCARFVAIGSASFLWVTVQASPSFADGAKWAPWLELGGYGATNEQSRGEVSLWAPLTQTHNSLVFTEIRGNLFEEDEQEGNLALGYRQMFSGGWNLGAFASLDARHTSFGSNFSQVALGLEALHPFWDIRVNGYLPFDDDEVVGRSTAIGIAGTTFAPTASLINNNVFLTSGGFTTTTTTNSVTRELAFDGIDGEVGAKIPLGGDKLDLRAYAGAFYFKHEDFDDAITGPKARLELSIKEIIPEWSGSRLTFETRAQWDDVRDDLYEAGVRLRLPFGSEGSGARYASLSAQEQRMSDRVERDINIVTHVATTQKSSSVTTGSPLIVENVEDWATGVDFDQTVVTNGAGLAAATGIGPNTLIIADGGVSGPVVLEADQTLQGGGSTIFVRGLTTGFVTGFTASGDRPTISSIATANNSHIAGVNIESAGGIGVTISGLTTDKVAIEQSSFDGGGTGLGVLVDNNVAINAVQIFNVEASNLDYFVASTASANVTQMTIHSATLTNTNGFAINGATGLEISGVEQTGGDTIGFFQGMSDLRILHYYASLDVSNQTGLGLTGITGAFINDVSIDTIGGVMAPDRTGINIRNANLDSGDLVFDNVRVSNAQFGFSEAVDGTGKVGNLTIRNSRFENITRSGLVLQNQDAGSNVVIENNTFNNVANLSGAVFFDFLGSDASGGGNVLTNVGIACTANPATGSVGYTEDGGLAATCP